MNSPKKLGKKICLKILPNFRIISLTLIFDKILNSTPPYTHNTKSHYKENVEYVFS